MEVIGVSQGGQQNTLDSMQTCKEQGEVNNGLQTTEDKNTVKVNQKYGDKNPSEKDIEELKKSVDKLNKFMESDGTKVVYEMHDKFKNDVMIKIVNSKTGEVLSEVPPKKILDMVAKMCEMVGVLFDKKA